MKRKRYNERISQMVAIQDRITSRDSTMTTFRNAITGPKFWKASWICSVLMMLQRLSGVGLLSIYIYSMLGNVTVETKGEFPITPVLGSFLLALGNLLFAIILSFVVPCVGRKTLAMCGCLGMLLCNISAGVCI